MLRDLFASTPAPLLLRAACAAAFALLATAWAIPALARAARRKRFGDRDDKSDSETLNALHKAKRSTPIVGGIAILGSALTASLLFADWSASGVWVLVATLVALGALGLADDIAKTFGARQTRGLSARQKLVAQFVTGLAVGAFLLAEAGTAGAEQLTTLWVPFSSWALPLGALGFLAFSVLLVTGSSNAVNLTDGLDGLAGGCALVALTVYLVAAGLAGDPAAAARLGIVPVPGAGELCVVLAALGGGLTSFLWFNRHPARVFMGDTGSLALGGVLAVAALLTKQELLLALVGGVFVAEALSVMAQVGCFKLTGKRVLRCAPLHHHFEFAGWPETRVVTSFHAIALLLGVLGLAGLGLGQ